MVNAPPAKVIPGDMLRYWLEPLKLKLPARGVYKSTGGPDPPNNTPGPILQPGPIDTDMLFPYLVILLIAGVFN
jgi:hypothetical protein